MHMVNDTPVTVIIFWYVTVRDQPAAGKLASKVAVTIFRGLLPLFCRT